MHIQVKGKQIDIGTALTEHVETTLTGAVSKYFDRTVDATVTFSRESRVLRCDTSVHLPTGLHVQSSGTGRDVYVAFEQGMERIEKQLRRYKRRLRDHHKNRPAPIDAMPVHAYVLSAPEIESEADEPETLQPVIVAESTDTVQSLSVGEAVMQMELADRSFLIFSHEGSGRVNVVFRRDDGNIGWIDPERRLAAE